MGLVYSEVLAKVRNLAPDTSARWSDAYIRKLIHLADMAIKEEGETQWASQEIDLQDGASYYTLNDTGVSIRSVEFASDGSNYDRYLHPTTLWRLDKLSLTWADDTSTEPEYYCVFSTPGEPNAKIMIYRYIASTSGEKIRVNYVACVPDNDVSMVAVTAPEWVQDAVYVPYVMSLLYSPADINVALNYWLAYQAGIGRVKERYRMPYAEDWQWQTGRHGAMRRGRLK